MPASNRAISDLLSVSWEGAHRVPSLLTQLGEQELCAQHSLRSVSNGGQWSGLAAAAVHFLRVKPQRVGASDLFDVRLMTRFPAAQETAGALSPALGFDWRPGIAIDGLVALALLGQYQPGVFRSSGQPSATQKAIEKDILKSLKHFEHTAGVGSLKRWANRHASSAMAFTKAAVEDGGIPAANRLGQVWLTALCRHPG